MDCCRYTKFSNLINLMVQANDFFKSYHLGWGADIDINILNNFNIDGITGDLYPAYSNVDTRERSNKYSR